MKLYTSAKTIGWMIWSLIHSSRESLPETGKAPAGDRVPPFGEMYNPVVNRALSQSQKLINAGIDQYGMPTMIRVELARDLGRRRWEQGKIESDQRRLRK